MIVYYAAYGSLLLIYCVEKIKNKENIKKRLLLLFLLSFLFC